jgi:FkbM family methyltransferase
MKLKHRLRQFLFGKNSEVSKNTPENHPMLRIKKLMAHHQINVVLDIGANAGQFAETLRKELGYAHKIISFEPLSTAFALLQKNAKADPLWDVFNFALGDQEQDSTLNIAGNSYSSSLLAMLPAHSDAAPESVYAGTETIKIKKLDTLFNSLCPSGAKVFIKIDTQGFEENVLKGAAGSLPKIDLIQMEMSLTPLYQGEKLFDELHLLMKNKGFRLVDILPGFSDPVTGQLLQADGVFQRCP